MKAPPVPNTTTWFHPATRRQFIGRTLFGDEQFQLPVPNRQRADRVEKDGNTYKVKFFIGSQRWQAIFASDGTFISEKAI